MIVSNKKRTTITTIFALSVVACLAMSACGGAASSSSASSGASSASSASSSSVSSAQMIASEALVFGNKTPTAVSVVLKNDTGADLTGLSALPVSNGSAIQLMKASDKIPAGKEATIYLEPGADNGVYHLAFTSNGASRQLHNVDFSRIDEATVHMEGETAYLSAIIGGNAVSSLQEELALANQQGESQDAQEQSSDEQQVEPASSNDESQATYEEPQTTYEEPQASYDEPQAPASDSGASSGSQEVSQSEEGCVTDIVLR